MKVPCAKGAKMSFTPTDYLPYDFANRRHIGPSPQEMDKMLQIVGAPSLDALIEQTRIIKFDWAGILWHGYAPCGPTQYFGKPSLVYSVYPLSARDFAGAIGSIIEFPNHGVGFNWSGDSQRVPAG